MLKRLKRPLLIVLVLAVLIPLVVSPSEPAKPAEAALIPDFHEVTGVDVPVVGIWHTTMCSTHRLALMPGGDGIALAVSQFLANTSISAVITGLHITIRWRNWTRSYLNAPHATGAFDYDVALGSPTTQTTQDVLETGPGLVSATLTGIIWINSTQGPVACGITPSSANATIPGVDSNNVTWTDQQLAPPATADLDNDNSTDGPCGNICDKTKDQQSEQATYDRNRKVCDQFDNALYHDSVFKPCKQMARLSVYDDNNMKYADEWYFENNQNGVVCPTDPSNAPSGWNGSYCPQPGYNHPNLTPTTTPQATQPVPRPTPDYSSCTFSGGAIVNCGGGDVSIQADGSKAYSQNPPLNTPTPAATKTPAPTPTNAAWVVSEPQDHISGTGAEVTIAWEFVPSGLLSKQNIVHLYRTSGQNPDFSSPNWFYTNNCLKTYNGNVAARDVGDCTIDLSGGGAQLPNGTYEWRLYNDLNHTTLITKSDPILIP